MDSIEGVRGSEEIRTSNTKVFGLSNRDNAVAHKGDEEGSGCRRSA